VPSPRRSVHITLPPLGSCQNTDDHSKIDIHSQTLTCYHFTNLLCYDDDPRKLAARKANNNNSNHDDIYSAVIYGASHMREFTVVHLGQSQSVPGCHQLVGQAANLTLSPPEGCYTPNIRPSPCIITQPLDAHLPSLGGWKAEST